MMVFGIYIEKTNYLLFLSVFKSFFCYKLLKVFFN